MGVLKVDPTTGESLDKNRSIEAVAAEIARKTKELEEYKERVKTRKPRKKKEQPKEETIIIDGKPVTVKESEPIPLKVDPLNAPNREVVVEELLEPLNAILDNIERKLQLMTKGFKFKANENPLASNVDKPKEFSYKPSVTRVQNGDDAFSLVKPSGVTTLKFEKLNKDVYIDRVLLNPIEVRELLKDDNAETILENLIIHGMFKNLFETKQLDSGKKKYTGSVVATLKRPGMGNNYCFKYTGDIEFIEIRLFSDITEVK
jgi:hypothetical protein